MKSISKTDPELARGWRASRVRACLDNQEKEQLIQFIDQRFTDRFFDPIRCLKQSPGNTQGYGFAIMALCSLLIESIQSFRFGLPSTYQRELERLGDFNPPVAFEVPRNEWLSGRQVFTDFFTSPSYRKLFPGIDGAAFYTNIRNGLLHQAQTKNGWTITIQRKRLCAPKAKVLNRNVFAVRLEKAFRLYLQELRRCEWRDELWTKAARKIWWLARLSCE
jgi:hypothetical protein